MIIGVSNCRQAFLQKVMSPIDLQYILQFVYADWKGQLGCESYLLIIIQN